jgi:putative oxidoreductase
MVFAYHGYDKLQKGVPMIASFLASLGIPFPSFFAPILIAVELVGGMLMVLGFFTHWVAKLFIIVTTIAFLTVHMTKGFNVSKGGYEFIMTLFAASVSLMITGAGKYSIDALFRKPDEQKRVNYSS